MSMPDGMMPTAEVVPAFTEFHRAQLSAIAGGTCAILATEAVAAALMAAKVPAPPRPVSADLRRLREQICNGRPTITVWKHEADALLALLPPPTQPPEPATETAEELRPALIALAKGLFQDAIEIAGHDERVRDALNRRGEQALDLAARMPSAPSREHTQRAAALFGNARAAS